MKIAVIGGGGVRSIFLAKSLMQQAKRLGIKHIVFMDNDSRKLNIFGKMSAKIAKLIDPDIEFEITSNPELAIKDADYMITTIPPLQEYCELARKIASPDVKIFNFTNPAGVVSQTLRDLGYDFTFGICDAPSGLLRSFAKLYDVSPERITGDCYGLNHLSYFNSIKLDGKEILPELLKNPDI